MPPTSLLLYTEDLELLLDRANDLVQFRIDAVLQEMSGATLCALPEDQPVTCEEFVQTTKVHLQHLPSYTCNKINNALTKYLQIHEKLI